MGSRVLVRYDLIQRRNGICREFLYGFSFPILGSSKGLWGRGVLLENGAFSNEGTFDAKEDLLRAGSSLLPRHLVLTFV
jgi:hypothetical protein